MKQQGLDELYLWKKRQMALFVEILDLTEQLDEAVSRRDAVSVNMLLSMREEPLQKARELEDQAREYVLSLPEEAAIRVNGLLSGEAAEVPEEGQLAEQVARNSRLLEKIRALDEKVSLQLGGSRSFYRTFRE